MGRQLPFLSSAAVSDLEFVVEDGCLTTRFPSSPSTSIYTMPKEVCRTFPRGCHFLTTLLHMDLVLSLAPSNTSLGVGERTLQEATHSIGLQTHHLSHLEAGNGGQSWVPIRPQHRHALSGITL